MLPTPTGQGTIAGLRPVRLLGRGGEGEVWEASDAEGRLCALKLLRPESLPGRQEVRRRAEWLLRIDHPALVRVRRSGLLHGALEGWGFVEMDFVDGLSLEAADADDAAIARLRPVADALDRLHAGEWSAGVPLVHRDVKPANLVDRPDGRLVLVDPSTLRDAGTATRTGVGTPLYAAPEALRGRGGPPADVYSFAATAVALLTGTRGDALADLVDHPEALAWQADVPDGVVAALAAQPWQRPGTCREALDRPATTVVLPDAEVRPPRLWPWLVVLTALALSVAVAAGLQGTNAAALLGLVGLGHLVAQTVGRSGMAAALLAPPYAWARLLATRASRSRRGRAWAEATFTGLLGPLAAALASAHAGVLVQRQAALGLAAALMAALWAVTLVPAAGGLGSLTLRILLLPVWLAGAALITAGCVALLPLAALVGRGRMLLALIGRTLAGVAGVAGARPRP
jgi:eukaryotic-like serine/threonine-protein kinase